MVKTLSEKENAVRLGKRIVNLRKSKGFSQSLLSYEADIDLSTLSRLERGVLNPSFSTLYKISKVLKVEMKDLFDY